MKLNSDNVDKFENDLKELMKKYSIEYSLTYDVKPHYGEGPQEVNKIKIDIK